MSEIIRLQPKKPPKPNLGIIIQARQTSTRFPGKSMIFLLGKPVLQHVLERAKLIRGPKGIKPKVILAVPDTDDSEPMLELADSLNIHNFCGSELNVLKRYYEAALFFKLDYIMRITADCPFIDPVICSQVIQLLMWRKLDYVSNCYPKRSFQTGLDCEAFSMDCLEAAYKLADIIGDWEHVTPWMQRTPEIRKANIEQKTDMSHVNWCVDYPEDIARLEAMANEKLKLIGANENDGPITDKEKMH